MTTNTRARKAQTLVVTAAAVLATWGASQATATAAPTTTPPAASTQAAPTSVSAEAPSTGQEVQKTQDAFAAHGITPTVTTNGSVLRKAYSEGNGKVVTVTTEPAPATPGHSQPRVNIGFGTGVYITLTHAEQNAVLTGSTGLVIGLICAATAGIACVVAGPIVAAAVTFVSTRGLCPNNGRLEVKINYGGGIQGTKCV